MVSPLQTWSATESAASKPSVPPRPVKKTSGDDKPVVPERPKPQVPARPAKPSSEAKDAEGAAPRQKPAVPARPVGGKIAALQAGFMSDLNKRLQLGPQAPKKEEPKSEDDEEKTEKAPLADARKGRARGPQRRAPTKTAAAGPPSASEGKPVLSFSMTRTLWCIDEEGTMQVEKENDDVSASDEKTKVAEKPVVHEVEVPESHEKAVPTAVEKSEVESEEDVEEPTSQETATETKTLATNTAGESILEETISKKPESDEVDSVKKTKEEVLSS